ncbi:hypothetical protein V6N13_057348 [Hibiscus sabdariffa]
MLNPSSMVGRRARKRMSGAANDSTTKFPISGKVPLVWLMHRLASPSPGHAQLVGGVLVTPTRPTTRGFGHVVARSRWLCATCLDIVTPNTGRPCVATVLGGVSRPSNVRASDLIKSQWAPCFMHQTVEPHYSSMSSPCGRRAQGVR